MNDPLSAVFSIVVASLSLCFLYWSFALAEISEEQYAEVYELSVNKEVFPLIALAFQDGEISASEYRDIMKSSRDLTSSKAKLMFELVEEK
ncbi:hypothetical protein O4H50_15465 [Vibrio diazotrophicus]|uniref:hypothetical protein n=1 Tax=Vibrio diazotrophicus TaxID=685 RepID=UPI0022AEB226|nr:hypothetical protein [Vibrio diazotrophicus]MCZ4373198.1 hypothetical protein [Vibrio diazotrophicus]